MSEPKHKHDVDSQVDLQEELTVVVKNEIPESLLKALLSRYRRYDAEGAKQTSEDEAILVVDSRRSPTLKEIVDLASPQTASIAIKSFLRIVSIWDISDQDALVLIGSPRLSDLADWLTGKSPLPEEVLRRISHILAIQTDLQALFEDRDRADGWVKRPNKAFGGKRALDRMLEGSEESIAAVRRYLDAVAEGQG